MKKRNVVKLGVLSLAVLAWTAFLPSASASVIGHLSVGICGGGGVAVTATSIDWLPDAVANGVPINCLSIGSGTHITSASVGNSLNSGSAAGTINDLPFPPPSIVGFAGFMSFTNGANLLFDLVGVGPGLGTLCSPDMLSGTSCSVFAGSPFVLTALGGNTAVSLSAHGTIVDPTDGVKSFWNGAFTTQIANKTPLSIQDTINSGGTVNSSFSGEFDTVVPEPVSLALIGGGLIALAAIKRRKLA